MIFSNFLYIYNYWLNSYYNKFGEHCDVFCGLKYIYFINPFKCPLLSDILSFSVLKYMAFKVIIIVIELMFLGHKYVFGPQKHIYAREHQLYCYINVQHSQVIITFYLLRLASSISLMSLFLCLSAVVKTELSG